MKIIFKILIKKNSKPLIKKKILWYFDIEWIEKIKEIKNDRKLIINESLTFY